MFLKSKDLNMYGERNKTSEISGTAQGFISLDRDTTSRRCTCDVVHMCKTNY